MICSPSLEYTLYVLSKYIKVAQFVYKNTLPPPVCKILLTYFNGVLFPKIMYLIACHLRRRIFVAQQLLRLTIRLCLPIQLWNFITFTVTTKNTERVSMVMMSNRRRHHHHHHHPLQVRS
jgi:hypothetical protein